MRWRERGFEKSYSEKFSNKELQGASRGRSNVDGYVQKNEIYDVGFVKCEKYTSLFYIVGYL